MLSLWRGVTDSRVCVCVCRRVFQADLRARLQQWGAEQCVGDVFLKLCSKLRVYTNYLNSYATAVRAIDKVINSQQRDSAARLLSGEVRHVIK